MKKEIEMFANYLHRRYGDRSTPKHYLSDVRLFQQQVGDKSVAQIRRQDVDDFIQTQLERKLKPTTINRRLASLHAFFEFVASQNPDEKLTNPVHWRWHKVKTSQPIARDASDEEVNALFGVIDDKRDQAMFGLMVGAGLRVNEVQRMRLEDLQTTFSPTQMARLRVRGKGQKERIVWVTSGWYAVMQEWLAVRPVSSSDSFFLNQHGRPLSVAGIQYRLKSHAQAAGVTITCHQLRHTFARRLAEQRMPIESISKLLGHAQVETTQRYTAGADPELRDEFLAAMQELPDTPPPTLIPTPKAVKSIATTTNCIGISQSLNTACGPTKLPQGVALVMEELVTFQMKQSATFPVLGLISA